MALVVADATGPGRRLPRGLLTGVAIGVKLTPGMFLRHALAARRWRAALVAGAVFAATVVIGALVQPPPPGTGPTCCGTPTGSATVAVYGNQSLLGVPTRLVGPGSCTRVVWVAAALVVLVVGLRAAVRVCTARQRRCWPSGVVGVVSTLLSPISWTHHWVWCVPVFGGLLVRAGLTHDRGRVARRRAVAGRVRGRPEHPRWPTSLRPDADPDRGRQRLRDRRAGPAGAAGASPGPAPARRSRGRPAEARASSHP